MFPRPDSFNVTIFTSHHYWWNHWGERMGCVAEGHGSARPELDYWFLEPDRYSTGGTGITFRLIKIGIPLGLHISFHWGGQ